MTLSNPSTVSEADIDSGKFEGKTLIDETFLQGLSLSVGIHITIYERATSDSKWSILSIDAAVIPKSTADLKLHQKKLEIQLQATQADIISYIFRF